MNLESLNQAISKSKLDDHSNGLETVSFKGKHFNYEVGFYAEKENNYELIVEDFGRMLLGNWKQAEPTKEQIEKMQQIVDIGVDEITGIKELERLRMVNQEIEAQDWEETKEMINANYYNNY